MDKSWLRHYPAGCLRRSTLRSTALWSSCWTSFRKHRDAVAYRFMGKALSFAQVDAASQAFGRLPAGPRARARRPGRDHDAQRAAVPGGGGAILRAGFVVVNVNPLYTPRELEHQLKDSGAKAIVIVENFAATLQKVIAACRPSGSSSPDWATCSASRSRSSSTPSCAGSRRWCRRSSCPARCASTTPSRRARRLPLRPAQVGPDDIAVLQYTGGTTGVSKGAVLLHRNLVANILQAEAWYQPALKKIPRASRS